MKNSACRAPLSPAATSITFNDQIIWNYFELLFLPCGKIDQEKCPKWEFICPKVFASLRQSSLHLSHWFTISKILSCKGFWAMICSKMNVQFDYFVSFLLILMAQTENCATQVVKKYQIVSHFLQFWPLHRCLDMFVDVIHRHLKAIFETFFEAEAFCTKKLPFKWKLELNQNGAFWYLHFKIGLWFSGYIRMKAHITYA